MLALVIAWILQVWNEVVFGNLPRSINSEADFLNWRYSFLDAHFKKLHHYEPDLKLAPVRLQKWAWYGTFIEKFAVSHPFQVWHCSSWLLVHSTQVSQRVCTPTTFSKSIGRLHPSRSVLERVDIFNSPEFQGWTHLFVSTSKLLIGIRLG